MPARDVAAVGIITDGYRTVSPDKGSPGGWSGIVYLRGLLDSFLQHSLCHFVLRATQYEGQPPPFIPPFLTIIPPFLFLSTVKWVLGLMMQLGPLKVGN